MAALPTQVFYDRVAITVNGNAYQPNGTIQSFRISSTNSSHQQMAMTPTGLSAGSVIGNSVVQVSWQELLPLPANYVCWRTFLIANPNTTVTVVPYAIPSGLPVGVTYVITGLNCEDQDMDARGESQACITNLRFNAQLATNLNG
jgi:hypothetical protein